MKPPISGSPGIALPGGGERTSVSRPSTAGVEPEDVHSSNNLRRRRSSGASDLFRERDAPNNYFTPTTSSPLALPGNQQRASESPRSATGSPPRQVASLPPSAPRPSSPLRSTSRPSSSGGPGSSTKSESPRTTKRSDSRGYSDMPPPAIPPATSNSEASPPKLSPPQPEEPPPSKLLSSSRSSVPYAPRNRITPPASVLLPLTSAEMERYK